MSRQEQFLDVVDRDEAERRFRAAVRPAPLGTETVPLDEALGRVSADDVSSPVDVPSFDRSNFDGFAVRAADTYGASETRPRPLALLRQSAAMGVVPRGEVRVGQAMAIATGGMLPRGADAVVMVEHTDSQDGALRVWKPVAPGAGVSFAGTDIGAGEIVLRQSELLTSRETGVLAAVGLDRVNVWRRPRVAIVSTGDELIAPGETMQPGLVYDSNARILADAVRELGCQPIPGALVPDDAAALRARLHEALAAADAVLLSGGTSKGEGDLSYRVVGELRDPGVVVHGVALKPGKPICLAASGGKPVAILPGFPTSAVFTFHELVAPILRELAGRPAEQRDAVRARLALKVSSEIGRTEFLLVGLVAGEQGELAAYPLGKGSGSVTAFSRADGFVTIERQQELLAADSPVEVRLLGRNLRPANLVAIGSHCVGLDYLLSQLQRRGFRTKFLAVGSMGGLAAAQRGECDLAGVHLLDPKTGQYNRPLLTPELELLPGYRRMQGIVFRRGDSRFEERTAHEAIARVKVDPRCVMVNRNPGSGTRVLLDQLLCGAEPAGYALQPRTHHAVAAAVLQGRADWGLAIRSVVRDERLGFLPLAEEQYDFVVPKSRRLRPAVAAFARLLDEPEVVEHLASLGLKRPD